MRRQPDLVCLLERAVAVAEDDGSEIGNILAEHQALVTRLFGIDEAAVLGAASMSDGELAPLVSRQVARIKERSNAERSKAARQRATDAAAQLASVATVRGDTVTLDAGLLLGPVIADPMAKYIAFLLPGEATVTVQRVALVGAARVLGHRDDLASWVDTVGLHLRWRGGRGGLNWLPQVLPASERSRALVVDLTQAPQAMQPRRSRPTSRWSWDVFEDVRTAC